MTIGQTIILFLSVIVFGSYFLGLIDEISTTKFYKKTRNKVRKQIRLQKDAEDRMKFLMELR